MDDQIKEIISNFPFEGTHIRNEAISEGLINTTYKAIFSEKTYIIQKINTNVFKNPDELMTNISAVTGFLSEKMIKNGENPQRQTLKFLKTNDGSLYYKDSKGESWRSYEYIDNCYTLSGKCSDEEIFEAAKGFGKFQYYLKDFNGETLFETIKNFHYTPQRYLNLVNAVEKDAVRRVAEVKDEIDFLIT